MSTYLFFTFKMDFLLGGGASACAAIFSNPFDVVKTRMQLQGELKSPGECKEVYRNTAHAFYVIAKTEGYLALQKGLIPAVAFNMIFNTIRLGIYHIAEVKSLTINENGKPDVVNSIFFGSLSGMIAAFASSPFYLVKTQMQSNASESIAVGFQYHYTGTTQAFRAIYAKNGIKGLWQGWESVVPRLGFGSAVQLATFSRIMDYLIGGLAGVGAGFFSNPFDVIRTRMQLQGELKARGKHAIHYRNVVHATYTIVKNDGITALQKGLVPALWFQLVVNGTRLGIYQTADDYGLIRNKNGETNVASSIFFGALSGAAGAAVGSPFMLVKTQLMSFSDISIAVGHQHGQTSSFRALKKIYNSHGLKGLWRGSTSTMIRNSVGSPAQIVTFSRSKEMLREKGWFADSPLMLVFVASLLGGYVKAVVMTPLDVCVTRLYNQAVDAQGRGLTYNGLVDCAFKITKSEGLLAFYKGFGPSFLRQGPHSVLLLVFWDNLKDLHQLYLTRQTITH